MRSIFLAALAVVLAAACGNENSKKSSSKPTPTTAKPEVPAPTPEAPQPRPAKPRIEDPAVSDTQPELSWKMSLVGSNLVIDYQIANKTQTTVYVVDKLVVAKGNKFARTDSITVMNGDPGTVLFAMAAVSSNRPSAALYTPTYRAVAAGATHEAKVEVPYPLKAWHPVGGANAIAADAKSAVFLIQYFAGDPPQWRTLASDDAKPLKVPEGMTPSALRSGPMPLPSR